MLRKKRVSDTRLAIKLEKKFYLIFLVYDKYVLSLYKPFTMYDFLFFRNLKIYSFLWVLFSFEVHVSASTDCVGENAFQVLLHDTLSQTGVVPDTTNEMYSPLLVDDMSDERIDESLSQQDESIGNDFKKVDRAYPSSSLFRNKKYGYLQNKEGYLFVGFCRIHVDLYGLERDRNVFERSDLFDRTFLLFYRYR